MFVKSLLLNVFVSVAATLTFSAFVTWPSTGNSCVCKCKYKSQNGNQQVAGRQVTELRTEIIKARGGAEITVEYGTISVPENRNDVDSRKIKLTFMRAKSILENPGTPVFPLAGGPGGSSISLIRDGLQQGGPLLLNLFGGDIVAIDQRGVGLSEPNLESSTKFGLSPERPGDRQQLLTTIRRVCREEADRWREQGVDLSGYTSVESADDIEAVRVALGYEKISLWGQSYGTHLALATIRRHGDNIDRAVLIAPEGPNHTDKLPVWSEDVLNRLGKQVASDPEIGKLIPDLTGMLGGLLEKLEQEPVYVDVDGVRVGISKFDVQRYLANQLSQIRGNADHVPAQIKQMADGDFEFLAKDLLEQRRDAGIWSAMQMMMDCASGRTAERDALIKRQANECLLSDTVNFPISELAEAWDAPDLGDEYRGPLHSDVPILFMAGEFDSRTPVSNATELMEHLPNSHLIIVENAAHDVNWSKPQLRDAWSRFLRGETVTMSRFAGPPIVFALPEGVAQKRPEGAVDVSVEDLARCEGDYRFDNGMVFRIRVANGRLIGTVPGKGDFDLWPKSATTYFAMVEQIPELTFVLDESGEVQSMNGGGVEAERVKPDKDTDATGK